MKLSNYAKKLGVSYRSAWEWYKAGKISGAFQTPTGTIIVPEERARKSDYVVIYARVSSSVNKDNCIYSAFVSMDTDSEKLFFSNHTNHDRC